MNTNRNQKIIKAALAVAIILIIVGTQIWINRRENDLASRGKMARGIITNYHLRPKSGRSLVADYVFSIDTIRYESEIIIDGITYRDFGDYFLGRTFPVCFDSTDPANSKLLVTPEVFESMHIPFPDTLAWIQDFWRDDL